MKRKSTNNTHKLNIPGFRGQVILALALLLLMVILYTVFALNRIARDTYYESSDREMRIVANAIDQFYEDVAKDIDTFANSELIHQADASVTSYFDKEIQIMTPSKNGGIETEIYEVFNTYGLHHPEALYVYMGVEVNGGYIQWPESIMAVNNYDTRNRNWYQIAVDAGGKVVSTPPYYDVAISRYIISNVKAIYDESGQLKGVIGIDVKQVTMNDMLDKTIEDQSEFRMMIHDDGWIIADSRGSIDDFVQLKDSDITGLEKFILEDAGKFTVSIDSREFIVNTYQKEGQDITFLTFKDSNEINNESIRLLYTISIFVLSIGLVMLILLVYSNMREKERDKRDLYDQLTGLPNRKQGLRIMEELINGEGLGHAYTFVAIKIRDFRLLQDVFGENEINKVIVKTIDNLNVNADRFEILSRMSIDEFIMAIDQSATSVNECTSMINEIFSENHFIHNQLMKLDIIMGIVDDLDNQQDGRSILSMLNTTLNRILVSNLGKQNWLIYDKRFIKDVQEDINFKHAIMDAITHKDFYLNFQPVIDSRNGIVHEFEALIRWKHKDLGMVSPIKLIQNLEQMGKIVDVEEWVIRESCRFIKNYNNLYGSNTKVAINISAIHFSHESFAKKLMEIVHEEGCHPQDICVELTESTMIESLQSGKHVTDLLRQGGFGVSLDDFGTGYSSLSYIREIRTSQIKIDKAFVDKIMHEKVNLIIIKALMEIADEIGAEIVVEGVETLDQLGFIGNLGCSLIQGYYFSKPLSFEDAIEYKYQLHEG